jgi:hypothetical protein
MSAARPAPAAAARPVRAPRAAPADGAARPVRARAGAGPSTTFYGAILTLYAEFHFDFLNLLNEKAGRPRVLHGLVPPAKEKKGAAAADGSDGAEAEAEAEPEPDGADGADGAEADGAEPAGAGKGRARRPAGPRFYQSADNLRLATPEAGRVGHITVTTYVREILVGFLRSFAELSDRTPVDPLSEDDLVAQLLAAARAESSPEGDLFRVVHHAATTAGPALRALHLSLQRDFPQKLSSHFQHLVTVPVDPGADSVAILFLNFCRVLAVHAAALVHTARARQTLSPEVLAKLLAGVGALAPPELQGAYLAVLARIQAEGAEKTQAAKELLAQKKQAKLDAAEAGPAAAGAADVAADGDGDGYGDDGADDGSEAPAPAPAPAPAARAPRGPPAGGAPKAAPAAAAPKAAPATAAAPKAAPTVAAAAPKAAPARGPPAGGAPRGAVRPVPARAAPAAAVDFGAVMGDLEGGDA